MAEPKDRLTVVETVYHRPFGEEATAVTSQFSRELETAEQLYSRRLVATEEWQPLDCGWLTGCSSLSIENLAGKNLQIIPTEAEAAEIAAKVLEICYNPRKGYSGANWMSWLVYPGESMRACPMNVTVLWVRCQSGKAKFIVTIIPR